MNKFEKMCLTTGIADFYKYPKINNINRLVPKWMNSIEAKYYTIGWKYAQNFNTSK